MSRRIVMEGHVTPAGKSVLDELGLDAGYVVKAKLAVRIQKSIAEMPDPARGRRAHADHAAEAFLLTRGKLDDISRAKLEECLRALGHDIEIGIGARHEGVGEIKVREFA